MQGGIFGIHGFFKKIASADCGHSMTEYALMCALVAFGATAGYQGLADGIASAYNTISIDFSGAFGVTNGGNSGAGGRGTPATSGAGGAGTGGASKGQAEKPADQQRSKTREAKPATAQKAASPANQGSSGRN